MSNTEFNVEHFPLVKNLDCFEVQLRTLILKNIKFSNPVEALLPDLMVVLVMAIILFALDHIFILKAIQVRNMEVLRDPDVSLSPSHFAFEFLPVTNFRDIANNIQFLTYLSLIPY